MAEVVVTASKLDFQDLNPGIKGPLIKFMVKRLPLHGLISLIGLFPELFERLSKH